jgi:hypothetical protein
MATTPAKVVQISLVTDANGNYTITETAVSMPGNAFSLIAYPALPGASVLLNEVASSFGAILVGDTVQFSGYPADKVKITR